MQPTSDAETENAVFGQSYSVQAEVRFDPDKRLPLRAIAENKSSRTIPGLVKAGVIFVERLKLRRHDVVGPPSWRNEHGHRVEKIPADIVRTSIALSRLAESEPPGWMIGFSRSISCFQKSAINSDSLARIQLRFP